MTATSQLRLLTLNINENGEATLYRLEKGWTLHFVLGPSLADKDVRIFVNHPSECKAGSDRHLYRELKWQNLSAVKSDVYDNFAEVVLCLAGSFNYYFTIDGSDSRENANGSGYFLVDPILHAGKLDDRVPLDCIRCQTVLAKALGPFPEWQSRLEVAKETGYNMIHFTPIQELGVSNSSYCIKEQLKLNSAFSQGGADGKVYTLEDVNNLVTMMKDDWNVLSLTDLVLNHTANESPWLKEHPECSYNMVNSPHLKPAYLLDRILWHFSLEVGEGKWAASGVPPELRTEAHLQHIRRILLENVLPKYAIAEYYQVHIDDTIQKFKNAILSGVRGDDRIGSQLEILPDPKFRRLKATVDVPLAIKLLYSSQPETISRDQRIINGTTELRRRLLQLNDQMAATINGHLDCAINNFIANGRWRFIDGNGPKIPVVCEKEPIMWNYFTLPEEKLTVAQEEENMHSPKGAYCMAHNGWVMSDDPLRNFAEPGSNIFLRRELIVWGDNVKLRYGESPEDCPFLWDYIRRYVTETARIFHGVRLDNCHSTPIRMAEYMLDEARKVRPDLYVIAELFTSSEYMDNVFINRLGLNSLIREGLNAWNSRELGRLVHRFGGQPVGAFMQPPHRPLVPSMAHALFFDQTHDNESYVTKRSVYDLLPSAAIISMSTCGTGSNRGYDELVPHHINVVKEDRLYQSWTSSSDAVVPSSGFTNNLVGITAAKRAFNNLHNELGKGGYEQLFVDSVTEELVSITRHNPVNHMSVVTLSHTAFSFPSNPLDGGGSPSVTIPGIIDSVIVEAKLVPVAGKAYIKDGRFINGLPEYQVKMKENIKVAESEMVRIRPADNADSQVVDFVNFPPGSAISFRVSLSGSAKAALMSVRELLAQFGYRMKTFSARNVEEISGGDVEKQIAQLTLNDLNRILFRCGAEERDDGKGFGSYGLENYGDMKYCGLQGMMSILNKIRSFNDLGHPLCDNLRRGDWLLDYIANRLLAHPSTAVVGKWFEDAFKHLRKAPRYLIPCYFDALVTGVFNIAEEVAWAKMSNFVKNGSTFIRMLANGSVQMCSFVPTSELPPLSSNLQPPVPAVVTLDNGLKVNACISMAAGLPHFASGIFRNWGRDTFISMRGLLLITGRFDEARYLILAYAGCLRHGLIPNLLGGGRSARYNCRDAVWFWLKCIQDYCQLCPDGTKILSDKVLRLYPTDDAEVTFNVDQLLSEVMQEALQRHSDGVTFRERNAGSAIDNDMSDNGFNNRIGIDWKTGFVFGGNEHNCGTWMDKMGSSDKAGNRGKPATPRDGHAVELIGLCESVTSWLATAFDSKQYPYQGVKQPSGEMMTFKRWSELICANFENYFYIDENNTSGDPRPDLINRRGIYKDTVGSSLPWTDYQLRPNFTIALAVAPEMCNAEHMWNALELAENHLLGPLGMKTLDPSDYNYNGFYINSDDSDDFKRAKGFNYHQGPEWVWPVGYFLRAKLQAAVLLEPKRPGIFKKTVGSIKLALSAHRQHLYNSEWKGIPELTNANGQHCADSCEAQAWSAGCLLEVLYDMEQLSHKVL